MAGQQPVNAGGPRLLHAGLVLDSTGRHHAPGAILIENGHVIACGSPQSIGALSPPHPLTLASDRLLLPALVNAHAHLDLSHIGPVPYTGDFVSWVDLVQDRRRLTPVSIREAVDMGVRLSMAGGTAIVGDIAGVGSLAALEAMRDSPLSGVSYIELFGQGPPERQRAAMAFVRSITDIADREANGVRLGLQPHAPYSCAKSIYEAAARLDLPLATHLAETLEELEFVHTPHGSALAVLLEARGVWHDSITGHGCHPIDALADVLSRTPFVAAHLNYIEDRHIETMSSWPMSVAYCPRASAYFGHPVQNNELLPGASRGHRYRDMLSAGINVTLGTDSSLCLDTPDRISVLDEMRFLYRRDGTDPAALLRMATINGAKALGFDEGLVTFDEGPIAGVIALPFDPSDGADPLVQVLRRDDAPQWVVGP